MSTKQQKTIKLFIVQAKLDAQAMQKIVKNGRPVFYT